MLNKEETQGVNILRGNPKEAVKKLAIPLMLSMMVISLYNIIDSFWVAGLGAEQLAGIGFVIPIEFLIMGVGIGLSAGISSVVSRFIGEKNDKMADNAAIHSVLIALVLSVIVTLICTVFMKELLIAMGGRGISLDYAMDYAQIYFIFSAFVIMPNAFYGLLRSEGDSKRTMYIMVFCAFLNMVLDPVFIYILNMGMFGAALSSVISLGIVLLIICYWVYIKKDTFLNPTLSNFDYNPLIIKDILNVAIPAIAEIIFMTFIIAIIHFIILNVSTVDSIAVFENGWRIITLATEPILAISTALVSIVAANYGANNFDNIKIAFNYSVKLSTIIGIIALVVLFVFAPQVAFIFSYGSSSSRLLQPTVWFFRIFSWFFLTFPISLVSTYLFQGLGKGTTSFIIALIREILGAVFFAYLFGIILNLGVNGVWLGLVVGYTITGLLSWIYARNCLSKLIFLHKL